LSDCEGAWLQPQSSFTSQWLSKWLRQRKRSELTAVAVQAQQHAHGQAAEMIAQACQEIVREAP
ncbi:MAG TPA: UDP-N-acetylglucosamine--N-acetylmuramyl-(pentapeptide) pyrophosphoryl-undecaprenol N-acetylglucosamine transferase, partial [Paenalcaligenes sp.]|nr:UDP-N-acetylglucosamine--N-acetylmuramyl-(pentapeptide) pyrophosphoryl-undecaprenol N-acetylglucosamine transferase [Paenalcaligenes sp.]